MSRRFVVRPRADVDLAGHYLFLSKRSAPTAERFAAAVKDALGRIRQDAQIGMRLLMPDRQQWELRFHRPKWFRKYLVIYRVTDDATYILRIVHGSQDWENAVRES